MLTAIQFQFKDRVFTSLSCRFNLHLMLQLSNRKNNYLKKINKKSTFKDF